MSEKRVPVSSEVAEHIIEQAVVTKGKVRAVEASDEISLSVTEDVAVERTIEMVFDEQKGIKWVDEDGEETEL